MSKKVCISGYYGFDNFGDETILKILVEQLKKYDCNIEITVFSFSPKKTSIELNVKSVNTFNIKDVIFSVLKSDCLISGGGSLLQDKTSAKSLLYYLFVITLAQIFGKQTVIFAQGIGPITNKFLKAFTMFLLKRIKNITVRDEESYNLLRNNGIKNIEKCVDPVWNLEIKKSNDRGKIGIQLRDFILVTDNFIKKLAQNINKYYSDKEIYLLSLQNKTDIPICDKLKNELININPCLKVKINENTSNKKVIEDICSLDTLIAMRYHACLTGIKAGVKVLPVNYDIKVETLAKEFNLNYINSINDMDKVIERFVNTEIYYDEEKINSKKFDFNIIKRILN